MNNKPVTIPKFTRVDAPPVRNAFQYFLTRAATWSCSPYVRIPARASLGGEGPQKPCHSLAYRTEPRQGTDPKGRLSHERGGLT